MRRLLLAPWILLLSVAPCAAAENVDVRRGVPDDVFLAVYSKHNPERDFQNKYCEEIWQTVEETQILDRVVKLVTSRMEDEQIAQAKGVIDELREAAKPISLQGLASAQEMVYAQLMRMSPVTVAARGL